MANKQCAKCKTVYNDVPANFHKQGDCSGGFISECKICRNKQNKKYREENREKIAEREKEYYQNNRDIMLGRVRKYQQQPEVKEQLKKYYSEYHKKYRQTPKGRAGKRAGDAKRRATKLQQTPDYANLKLITKIYEHCPENYDVDHMVPISRGGLHHESNLCYLPSNINYQKHSKSIEQFGVDKFNKHVVYWQNIL